MSAGFGVLIAQERIAIGFATWLASNVQEKCLAPAALGAGGRPQPPAGVTRCR